MSTGTILKPSTRLTWMDDVRGTAILLLLLWHASAVPVLFGTEMPEVVRSANAFFMPYRMPTLMLLSGMLLARSLRKPLPTYYAGKIAMVLWPYLVWVIIAKATFLDIEGMPWWHWRAWYATTYLWFLFFIGVYYAAAPLLRRLPPGSRSPSVPRWGSSSRSRPWNSDWDTSPSSSSPAAGWPVHRA